MFEKTDIVITQVNVKVSITSKHYPGEELWGFLPWGIFDLIRMVRQGCPEEIRRVGREGWDR